MAKEFQIINASKFFKMLDEPSIQEAFEFIHSNKLRLKPSTKYSVSINNILFPPKDFLRIIAEQKGYKINEDTFFGGHANKPFEKLGFQIISNQKKNNYDESLVLPQIIKYQNAIDNSDWLRIDESYKFNFIKWVEEHIDFKNDSNEVIKQKIEESQQNTYSPGSNVKGVNFIQTITRYQDNYLTIEDIEKLRNIIQNNGLVNKENLSLSFGSFPKTSAFLCLFAPERFMAYDGESIPAYEYLSKGLGIVAPKRNFKSFEFYQIFYNSIKKQLKKSNLDTTVFKELLNVDTLTELHWNFITQDFLLFITRKIMNTDIPAYYCVGFHFYGQNPTNQLPRFIKNGIWVNGYDDKFINTVKEVPIGSLIAAKTSYTMNEDDKTISVLEVHCIGRVLENLNDGKTLKVDWQKDFKSFILKRKGGYRNTISKVHNRTNIDAIFYNDNYEEKIIEDEVADNQDDNKLQFPLNQILYGPPGTGKTYKTKKIAVEIIENKEYSDSKDDRENILERYEEYLTTEQIHFTTFHQSMAYEDFIEGIKPKMTNGNNGEIEYEIKSGLFKQLCQNAAKKETTNFDMAYGKLTKDIIESEEEYLVLNTQRNKEFRVNVNSNGNLTLFTTKKINQYGTLTAERLHDFYFGAPTFSGWEGYANGILKHLEKKYNLSKETKAPNQKYVLIIDEINRGNVSAIFGELITLIEKDKRAGQDEAISCLLPYSKEKFSVPDNIYIVATMNTADRSVEALDTALRRRFSFKEILPDPTLLNDHKYQDVNLEDLLTKINERIELLIDKDHQIGHSYFYEIKSLKDLRIVFKDKIIPLLEEYFYGDFGKIGLVLGENFIEPKKIENKSILAKFKAYEDIDFVTDKKIFRLKKEINEMNVEDFISIYENQIQ
ncbi:McrB family protein [Arenibacter sp. ARW7G5Y1]|uniref:McrB family protein n=1 Tax=Arenibacter sp. ARW7G5Y1 TaxID=2135619 RepID=UPI000D75EAB1|nr:AAA family ATPase [Arenibacter sp. ARW7G5Y1]PXX22841.1 dynein-related subfamily AAA family protein [Arenibacter sp. ARW7G5Y1]